MRHPDEPKPAARHWYSRGYLPHYDVPGASQFITFRQADSLPTRLLRLYARLMEQAKTGAAAARAHSRIFTHAEKFLGKGHGSCRLRDPRAAKIVEDALLFYDSRDYQLIAWVVMPNHVHVVARLDGQRSMERITRNWKSWTALQINGLTGESGRFWQKEVFDRLLRDSDEQGHAVRYVEMNPVHAGLCKSPLDWPFSSARRHPQRWGVGIDWDKW
jgi:REP element-mobilizing transposase RayT